MPQSRPIALSYCPRTTDCADAIRDGLERLGYSQTTFVADGAGGRSLEEAVRERRVCAVIEVSLTELPAELLATGFGAGPDRLTAAAHLGVPQLVILGGLDGARTNSCDPDRLMAELDGHQYLRTSPAENDRLGQEIAFKMSASRGPAVVLVPLQGLSELDAEGQRFWRPEASQALLQSIRQWVAPQVSIVTMDAHLCDAEFTTRAVALAAELMP